MEAISAAKSAKSFQEPTRFTVGEVNRDGRIGSLKNICIAWKTKAIQPAIRSQKRTRNICRSLLTATIVASESAAASAMKPNVSGSSW